MGNANGGIRNDTCKTITVISFNNADLIYTTWNNMIQIAPGDTQKIEAAADASGLKVAVVYGVVGSQLLWRMWFLRNGQTITINSINAADIRTSGDGEHKSTGQTGVDANTAHAFQVGMETAVGVAGLFVSAAPR